MFTNRTYTRHPVSLRVWVNHNSKWNEHLSVDVSRRGVFIRMVDPPFKAYQAVPIRVELPSKRVLDVFAQVKRVVASQGDAPTGAGIGVEFFAIGAEVKNAWDDFITSMRAKKSGDQFSEDSQNLRDLLPPPHVRDMLKKMRDAGEIVEPPALQRPVSTMQPVMVEVAPASVDRLRLFAERVARAQAVFLKPKHAAHLSQKVHVILTHPDTDEEHIVYANVEPVVHDADGTYAGVQVRFHALSEREQRSLAEFVARTLPELGELPAMAMFGAA